MDLSSVSTSCKRKELVHGGASPFPWLGPLAGPTYVAGAAGPRQQGIAELASNENPFGPSPAALVAARDALTAAHRYPDAHASGLSERVASLAGLPFDRVIVSPGTTSLIDLICRALLDSRASAVVSERSFLAYTTSILAAGAQLLSAPMAEDTIDLDAIRAVLRPDTRLIFLANPNNPTGTAFSGAAFAAFMDRLPPHVLVVLDEAYADYARDLPDGAAHLRAGRPILLLRTFSKVYGLAGFRVGYGLGPAAVIARLRHVQTAFAVSQVAQAAALAALDDTGHLARSVRANTQGRAQLQAGLRRLGLCPAPSAANFVYVDLGRPAAPVQAALLEAGVRVRELGPWGAPTALRITVGRTAEVDRAMAALATALGHTVHWEQG